MLLARISLWNTFITMILIRQTQHAIVSPLESGMEMFMSSTSASVMTVMLNSNMRATGKIAIKCKEVHVCKGLCEVSYYTVSQSEMGIISGGGRNEEKQSERRN